MLSLSFKSFSWTSILFFTAIIACCFSRFIIFDDIEKININSINSLLKIIEEPTIKNYFILINNKSKPLLETIRSRCIVGGTFKVIINK